MSTVHLSSSLRAVSPHITLDRAKARAASLGISRVTDITRLDRIGIPVYASIRPSAATGSLCVNAGKGLHPIEAEVGAYMEAIEFALAEPGASPVTTVRATARDVLDGHARPEAILDLCPRAGARVRLDAPLDCVEAEEISTGARALVPAELVFLPYRPSRSFIGLFGTSSNGLSSGNTLSEATVHGLSEVIERDVKSFEAVHDTSAPVDLDSVEEPGRSLVEAVRAADLELHVRTAKNPFGVPYFFAIIHDPDACAPHLLNGGFGCHPHRSVAFVRAVAEAAQSRLSFIHGGRDDLADMLARYRGWNAARKRAFVESVVARAAHGKRVRMQSVDDHSRTVTTVEQGEEFLLRRFAQLGLEKAYRVTFSAPDDDLHVVRVVVPRMELFSETVTRFGVRLRDHARASPIHQRG
jgi:ribosomal protein S12 methylthiotransferase accessory factor